jgi:hypothetical protein
VVEQPSAIDEIPRTKREEIQGEGEDDDNAKRLPTTKLGKRIVALIGAKYLTQAQENKLSGEFKVHSGRKGDMTVSPVELYEAEPLFDEYIVELVDTFKNQLSGSSKAGVSRQRMVNALTSGGGEGKSAVYKTLQDAIDWIDEHATLDAMNARLDAEPSEDGQNLTERQRRGILPPMDNEGV